MDIVINYWWAFVGLGLLAVLVIWLIVRNVKDEKRFEKDLMQSEIKPEKHDDEEDKAVKP
jgi:flagellar biosynthesis/type III secretory pathway M-ring protein FliF/YscJ